MKTIILGLDVKLKIAGSNFRNTSIGRFLIELRRFLKAELARVEVRIKSVDKLANCSFWDRNLILLINEAFR
jgi:hypothetical protein